MKTTHETMHALCGYAESTPNGQTLIGEHIKQARALIENPEHVIRFYVKDVYGVARRYVTDQTQAQAIALLTGAKTLEDRHLTALRALGFTLQETLRPTSQTRA